ncbi:flagellar assembly protein FliH [Virgibacillus sp. W0430]|uniref:flagellar assembly protein FliH n=1 Tax=Virgibacillus sp. W0430 TaxID=3391580 RepID=UPI003F47F879
MSNSASVSQTENKKVIKIKPIQAIIQQEETQVMDDDQERRTVEHQLKKMKEELRHVQEKKEIMVQEITTEIELEKQKWSTEKAELVKQAQKEGFQAGFEQGKLECISKYEEQIEKANALTRAATKDYYTTVEESRDTIIQLAIHTAEKILKGKLTDDPALFLPIVKTAITEMKELSKISIYLHPDDYEFVLKQKDDLIKSLDGDTKLSIYMDQKLAKNDCLIVHPNGQIDAGVDTQLQQIARALQEVSTESEHE